MNIRELRRRKVTRRELGLVSASLRPIRSCEEVGRLMGLSTTVVFNLESSALRKIIIALHSPLPQTKTK